MKLLGAGKVDFGRLYVSNKMTGIPYFNAPWFDATSAVLMVTKGVADVFNPAQHDRNMGLNPMLCPNGSADEARAHGGLSLRNVLGADWDWIAHKADGVVVGPSWPHSLGAISEIACAQALSLPVWESKVFFEYVGKGRPDLLALPSRQLPPFKELLGVPENERTYLH